MATAPVKSQPLHNFSLPFLKWGGTASKNNHPNSNHHHHHHHRFRRPTPADSSQQLPPSPDHPSEPDSEPHRHGSRTSRNNRFALPPCSHKHQQHPPLCNDETDDEAGERKRNTEDAATADVEETVQKPWNLRPRKPTGPVFSIGAGGSRNNSNGEVQEAVHSVGGENTGTKSFRLRGETMQCGERKKEKKSKFWIALSKEEIEEDVFVMTGSRPSRRPKKRPKNVQKQMDSVFPGLWLVGVTADAYRVADTPPKR